MRRIGGLSLAVGLAVSALAVTPASGAPQATEVVATAAASAFAPVSPVRVLDTRVGGAGPVGPGRTVVVDLSADLPASTTAVVLNVTGTAPTANTFVTAYPSGTARPNASNLNLVVGETRPNLVTVAVGADGNVVLYNNAGSVHLIADLAGYYATDPADAIDLFTPYYPVRVMDTRIGFGPRPAGPVGPGGVETIDLSDRVPDSATAVVFNLTGTGATTGTFVTAWPAVDPLPTASNLNLTPGATSPNQVVVALGEDLRVNLYNNSGSTHLIVDVAGFYTADYGAEFTPVTPTRVLDTRNGTGGQAGAVGPGGQVSLGLGSIVPQNTTGVVANVTGTQPTAGTYVTAWPAPEPRPNASNLNLAPGQTAPNLTTVGVGTNASVSLYNNAGSVHLIADLAGYFSLPAMPCVIDCVVAWGSNEYGALGTGSYAPSATTPAEVYGLSDVAAVSGDGHTGYALTFDGFVWAWGANWQGELGNGWHGASKSVIPVPVVGLDQVVAIDGSMALRSDGTVWAWSFVPGGGFNEPAQVQGLTGVVAIAAAKGTGYAVKSDGTVWAWGQNASARSATAPRRAPTRRSRSRWPGSPGWRTSPRATTVRSPSRATAPCGRGATTGRGSSATARSAATAATTIRRRRPTASPTCRRGCST